MSVKNNAAQLVSTIRNAKHRLVLAESCTGGLAASQITQISGVSDCFCGSAVTYLDEVKTQWLQVNKRAIETYTAVSEQVAREMVKGVLSNTTLATVGAAITGHVGPGAPPELDGVIFTAFMQQNWLSSQIKVARFKLASRDRVPRQRESVDILFEFVMKQLGQRGA